MTRQEYENELRELRERLEKLETTKIEADIPKRWKPTHNEGYLLIRNDGNIGLSYWNNDDMDQWRYLTGNCFKTKEEVEEYRKQIEFTARYKNYIEKHSDPLDWNNGRQGKYYAEFGYEENKIEVDGSYAWKRQGVIYASSEEVIWDAINCIGEDNFKKYVLGVFENERNKSKKINR